MLVKNDYGKDYMKIEFDSDDDLPLNKLQKFCLITLIIRCVLVKMVNFTHKFFYTILCMNYRNVAVRKN